MRVKAPSILAPLWAAAALTAVIPACTVTGGGPVRGDGGIDPIIDGSFVCVSEEAEACVGQVHYSCERSGEFLSAVMEDCAASGRICVPDLWCLDCAPNSRGCDGDTTTLCRADGSGFDPVETCDVENGFACRDGQCVSLCEEAVRDRSYVGCEFYAADLDNAAIGAGRDASAQQYAVVVSNPGSTPTEVVVEVDLGLFGGETVPHEVERVTVLPGDLEVLELPRRELDGSSSFTPCTADEDCLSATQACWCGTGVPPGMGSDSCFCRSSRTGSGLDDGTNSALTAHAYRLRSDRPIVAYQFNPLDNVGVFSNDASLLLPTSAIGRYYTVVGWPQTIANSDNPDEDFDSSTQDEDLRAFLTIVGSAPATSVTITLGPLVRYVVGLPDDATSYGEGDVIELELGEFDVINLETQGYNADFTGTIVDASQPVSVFVGGEASDAPRFDDLANRRCCADHLEEQLFPDDTLGRRFFVGLTPRRSHALNAAFVTTDSVGMYEEPESVRIVAVEPGITQITTTLPSPYDFIELGENESITLVVNRDFAIDSTRAISVLQVISSQDAVGIPYEYPGGDPSIIALPPVDQYRSDYVFLTPDLYAFDFVTIVAPATAGILLDGQPLDPSACTVAAADGLERRMDDPPPDWLVYRCQLSFPDVIGLPRVRVEEGLQNDGYHTLLATEDVQVVITGFDAYVSYGYAGGLNLDPVM